jgi:hypothetical protein
MNDLHLVLHLKIFCGHFPSYICPMAAPLHCHTHLNAAHNALPTWSMTPSMVIVV